MGQLLIEAFMNHFSCSYIHNDLKIAVLGPKVDLTYEYQVSDTVLYVHHVVHVYCAYCTLTCKHVRYMY